MFCRSKKVAGAMLVRSPILILLLGLSCGKCETSDAGVRLLMNMYEDCRARGLLPCLKMKAITFFDRVSRSDEILLDDDVSFVKDPSVPVSDVYFTEKELEETLPRGDENERDSRLNDILVRRISDFVNGHKLVLKLPKLDPYEMQEEAVEGRGKSKKMMSLMMMALAMKKAATIPMIFGFLLLLAKKALLLSKVALTLTLLTGLKKLKSSE